MNEWSEWINSSPKSGGAQEPHISEEDSTSYFFKETEIEGNLESHGSLLPGRPIRQESRTLRFLVQKDDGTGGTERSGL